VFPNAPHTLVERSKTGEPFRWPHITPGYADLLASWVLYRESLRVPLVAACLMWQGELIEGRGVSRSVSATQPPKQFLAGRRPSDAERVGTRTAALMSAIPIKPLSRLEADGEMLIASYFSTCVR
jgi:hypothetical protein